MWFYRYILYYMHRYILFNASAIVCWKMNYVSRYFSWQTFQVLGSSLYPISTMKISRVIPKQDKKILTCFHTVLECKSFTRIILITVKDEPQCCSIACYSFSKILWGSFTAMSWCLTIIGIVVLSARSRSKSCKKKMNLLRPALRHFVFTWLQQRQAVVCV